MVSSGNNKNQNLILFSFDPEGDMKSMVNLEIYNFDEKYPKRDRNKLAFIGCYNFIEI
jgi:hypothetical protein